MKTQRGRIALLVCVVLAVASPACTQVAKTPAPFSVTRYQSSIDAFVASDRTNPPPKNAILFIGSSIFREWATLAEQMAPLPVFNRAFGGSRTIEVLHYTDTIVLPYAPKIVVYYCGSNDINANALPPEIAANFRAFAELVHAKLPQTRILFASIIRAPQKRERWDRVDAANALIRNYCASDPRLAFVDVNPAVFDGSGRPRLELYRDDLLHYHPAAYAGFAALIKPVLERSWREVGAPQNLAP